MWTDFQNSFTSWFVRKFSMYTLTKTFTSPAMCCCLVKVENLKKWFYWFWQHPQRTVDMFLRTLWTLDLRFDSKRQTVSRLMTLTDWLTFWSLSDDVSNQQLNAVHLNVVASWWFFSPWLSLHRLRSFYTIFHVLYTYLRKIISAVFLWQVT